MLPDIVGGLGFCEINILCEVERFIKEILDVRSLSYEEKRE